MRLLQNFSFARATVENCMFRSPQGEKLHSLGKTNRVLQEALIIIGGYYDIHYFQLALPSPVIGIASPMRVGFGLVIME